MWRAFRLEQEFPQPQLRSVPISPLQLPQRSRTVQTPLVPGAASSNLSATPTILDRFDVGTRQSDASSRSDLVAQIRQSLTSDAPFLSIAQCIELTTELASSLPLASSTSDIRKAARKLLLFRELIYPSVYQWRTISEETLKSKTVGHLEVVVAAPLRRDDGSLSVFGTVSANLDTISEWTLAKGNVLANTPVSLSAMFALGGAESRVIDSQKGVSTVQLELRRGALLQGTQYTAFLCCRTESASAVDSVTFCT